MAYRQSHYRRGYYRRTPSGGITWVSPTIVSGYNYEPGTIDRNGHFTGFKFVDNGKEITPTQDSSQSSIIEQICQLFEKLDSEHRKICLDILDSYDIKLDEAIGKETIQEEKASIKTSLFSLSIMADGTLSIDQYLGMGIGVVQIPETVQGRIISQINNEAFYNCTDVCKVIISKGIKRIGDKAFSGCSKLSSVVFPDKLEWIGDEAFRCTSIEAITIPSNVYYVGKSCFSSCSQLRTASVLGAVKRILPYTFAFCDKLESVSLAEGTTEICEDAFCFSALQGKLIIPYSCKSIDFSAFKRHRKYGESNLELNIPTSVKTITDTSDNDWYYAGYIVIYCNPGSEALAFAKKNMIPYKPL